MLFGGGLPPTAGDGPASARLSTSIANVRLMSSAERRFLLTLRRAVEPRQPFREPTKIKETPIPLEGELKQHLEGFDFTIFKARTVVEMIIGHSKNGLLCASVWNRRHSRTSEGKRVPEHDRY